MSIFTSYLKKVFYKKYLSKYDFGNESLEAMKIVKGYTMSTPIDMATLYELVLHLDKYNIVGDFVECGVWKGGSAGIMAKAHLCKKDSYRQVHLFDMFDDILAPNPKVDGKQAMQEFNDHIKKTGKNISDYVDSSKPVKGFYDGHGGAGSVEIVRELLVNKIGFPENKIKIYKGLFQDTIPYATDIKQIALLRLDGDWYDSIKICLEHFYDRVVIGGVIIIDDYSSYDGCKKALDEFMESKNLTFFKCYSRPQTRFFFKY
jgi:O-methyltransferase